MLPSPQCRCPSPQQSEGIEASHCLAKSRCNGVLRSTGASCRRPHSSNPLAVADMLHVPVGYIFSCSTDTATLAITSNNPDRACFPDHVASTPDYTIYGNIIVQLHPAGTHSRYAKVVLTDNAPARALVPMFPTQFPPSLLEEEIRQGGRTGTYVVLLISALLSIHVVLEGDMILDGRSK